MKSNDEHGNQRLAGLKVAGWLIFGVVFDMAIYLLWVLR